ncbi:YkuS family protein [Paenibacillus flagellatus]|uniref:Uncharacterized protein n=1 Tax=Paenibacillus flagellatus TaxID=2211139 RepID=A0A2V5K757_9BACL|nr:YkuS family protein [Paenibacillus flagellatus]PYI53754.1 hypothetical protein DLM86_14395 [Paenibacillus flagellatus]
MATIAVENSLSNVKQALEQNGYQVVSMDDGSLQSCDCCVISGQDKNVLGITETVTQASVINAEGLTVDEVVQQVNRCVQ